MAKESIPQENLELEVWDFIAENYVTRASSLQATLTDLRAAKKDIDAAYINEEPKITSAEVVEATFCISARSVADEKGINSKSLGISKADVPTMLKALRMFAKENQLGPMDLKEYVEILMIGELTEAKRVPKKGSPHIERAKSLIQFYKKLNR